MPLRIYGAGMAGLLAAMMLRRFRPEVYEAQDALPDNHGALLRFRSDVVARETALPFQRVNVIKAVKSNGKLRPVSSLADANRYSIKVTGEIRPRSVLDLAPVTRYIAPDNFLSELAHGADIRYGTPLTMNRIIAHAEDDCATITTIPMPVLMKIVGWPHTPVFRFRPIWSVTAKLPDIVDVYQTIYYPGEDDEYYRASITGDRLIIEYARDPYELLQLPGQRRGAFEMDAKDVLADFGLSGIRFDMSEPKRQEYGKLLPIPEAHRQEFILAMSDRYKLYSVGRFATWRQILLDDVAVDIRKVEQLINRRNSYTQRLESI